MYRYDKKISCTTIDSKIIQQANSLMKNNPNNKVLLLEIPNTKGISSESLKELDSRVLIRIAGGYDDERVKRFENVTFEGGETGKYFFDAVIYTRNEVINMIREMEEIEKGFEDLDLKQLEKVVYMYSKLKSGIMYDPEYKSKKSENIRSLRGLTSKRTVCAGYAMIFKELLDRQGIECYYVRGRAGKNGGRTCMECFYNRW